MHVGNEDALDLTDLQIAAKELMLRSLTAIEEPEFCPLG